MAGIIPSLYGELRHTGEETRENKNKNMESQLTHHDTGVMYDGQSFTVIIHNNSILIMYVYVRMYVYMYGHTVLPRITAGLV